MKIALIRQKYTQFGGAERYVNELAGRLTVLGHQVHVLAREWESHDQIDVVFHRIHCGGPTFIRLPAFARGVAEIVAKEKFDLVHSFDRTYSQDIFRAGDGCHVEYLSRRARVEGRWRGWLDRINPRHRAFLRLEARLFADPRLKLVLVNSRQGAEEIIRHYGWSPDKISVLYNGLDKERFHPGLRSQYRDEIRRELSLNEDAPVALFVGSGYARKGLRELIRSLSHLQLTLLVAGRDRPQPYAKLASDLKLTDRVRFLGPRSDTPRLYAAADVFVLPSWYEPFSNACLEAMASGLPVVTTKETGAAEVIGEGINGFLVDFPVDSYQLAEMVEKALILDRQRLLTFNKNILAPFDWELNLAQTMDAYKHILERA
ncbi:MAG: glycosyltransferase family 4 protein [Deltaproteobacteria bacterium]|nr:glycosyltransferase family 4 protein [Deltaproteobacteria bacterium]